MKLIDSYRIRTKRQLVGKPIWHPHSPHCLCGHHPLKMATYISEVNALLGLFYPIYWEKGGVWQPSLRAFGSGCEVGWQPRISLQSTPMIAVGLYYERDNYLYLHPRMLKKPGDYCT